MKGALVRVVLYACMKAFYVKDSILRVYFLTKGIIQLWVYDEMIKVYIFGPLNSQFCAWVVNFFFGFLGVIF